MTIDPRTAAWWNFAFILLTGIAAGTVDFAGLADNVVHIIRVWATNGAFAISCANLVFHLYSSSIGGPMTKGP
jgi:hypothetical protein